MTTKPLHEPAKSKQQNSLHFSGKQPNNVPHTTMATRPSLSQWDSTRSGQKRQTPRRVIPFLLFVTSF
uniref:Putative ovule protein n=1 Tax=Solanum chacoense TaxID=4108 RepID=A0A0V0HKK3_SOLCH